jgi:hypothetical protein
MNIAHVEHVSIALAALVLAAAFHPSGDWLGRGTTPTRRAAAPTLPDWFLPIWDAYDRNPAVTPRFDFASSFSTDVPSLQAHR